MRILVDVFSGNARLGGGPLMGALQVTVKRALDGAGSVTLNFAASDGDARNLLQNERQVRLRVEEEDYGGSLQLRELARGVVRTRNVTATESEFAFVADGPDDLDALTRRSVRLNRQYGTTTAPVALSAIAADLIGLVPEWSVVFEAGVGDTLQVARFAGVTVLKALLRLVEELGLHLRPFAGAPNVVEIGAFGSQTRVMVTNVESLTREAHSNRSIILVDKMEEGESSHDVRNRIFPIGAGEGQAALTLRDSTRITPYTIKSLLESDGATVYYLEDAASIAQYGVIEKANLTFKEIAPIANSATAKRLAANALYDAAAAWLKRNSVAQKTYKVNGVKLRERLNPGDKIRVAYKGQVWRDNTPVNVLDVDDWFWLLSVAETVSDSGVTASLEIGVIDRIVKDDVGALVEAVEKTEVRNVAIATFPVAFPTVSYDTIKAAELPPPFDYGPGFNRGKRARMDLRINAFITDVTRVELRFVTFPLHLPARTYAPAPGTYWMFWDVITSPNYPSGISLRINDVDVTAALGGPWNSGLNQVADVVVDISPYIVNAAGGLYQNHKIELECASNTGEDRLASPDPSVPTGEISEGYVLMTATVLGVAQAILPT